MLLVALGLKSAQEFSVFPSLLLFTTLFSSLNVATRAWCCWRRRRPQRRGPRHRAFGRFAVGGSLIVGAVVFLILLVVNFASSPRLRVAISEVAARFTLDACRQADGRSTPTSPPASSPTRKPKAAQGPGVRDQSSGAMDGPAVRSRRRRRGSAHTGINIVGRPRRGSQCATATRSPGGRHVHPADRRLTAWSPRCRPLLRLDGRRCARHARRRRRPGSQVAASW